MHVTVLLAPGCRLGQLEVDARNFPRWKFAGGLRLRAWADRGGSENFASDDAANQAMPDELDLSAAEHAESFIFADQGWANRNFLMIF